MQVFVEGVGGVNGVEFLGGVFAGIFEDDFLAAGVFFSISFCMYSHLYVGNVGIPGKNSVTSYAFP